MKLINPNSFIETSLDGEAILNRLEKYGRTSYKSEDHITKDSSKRFIKMIINNGHESVIEHESVTARFIVDRGVTHELVRHRIGSYTQESTRYCNYSTDKFDNSLTFIRPLWFNDYAPVGEYKFTHSYPDIVDTTEFIMIQHLLRAEKAYNELIDNGWKPQQARAILPNAIKTEIVSSFNLREWRHVFKERAVNKRAHPQIREVMIPLLRKMQLEIPIIFDDLQIED